MVYFTCNHCGASLKKNQVATHFSCRKPRSLCCIDCLKDFTDETYVAHTKCISETEKYSGKDFKPGESFHKGEKKQEAWTENIRAILDSNTPLDKDERRIFELIIKHENIPRKKPKFQNFLRNINKSITVMAIDKVWAKIENQAKKNTPTQNQNNESKLDTSQTLNGSNSKESPVKKEEVKEEEQTEKLSKKERKEKRKREKYENEIKEIETNKIEENEEEERPKKKKKKAKKEESNELEGTEKEEEINNTNKKSKKNKKEKTHELNNENEEIVKEKKNKKNKIKNEENGIQEETEEINNKTNKKNKKRKLESNEEEEELPAAKKSNEDEEAPMNAEIEEPLIVKPGKFQWSEKIIEILESAKDNELSLKRLRKKIFNEYSLLTGKDVDEKISSKFTQQLEKSQNVVVHKDKVTLKSKN